VEKIETAWSAGATQGQCNGDHCAAVFGRRSWATFLFGFGDYAPGERITDVISGQSSMRHWIGVPRVLEAWTGKTVSVPSHGAISATILLGAQFFLTLWRKPNPVHKNQSEFCPSCISIFSPQQSAVLSRGRSTFCFRGQTVWDVLVWNTLLYGGIFRTIILYIGLLGAR